MIWMWITYGWLLEKAKICDGYQFMILLDRCFVADNIFFLSNDVNDEILMLTCGPLPFDEWYADHDTVSTSNTSLVHSWNQNQIHRSYKHQWACLISTIVRNLRLEYEWLQFVSLTNEVLDVETVSWSAYHSQECWFYICVCFGETADSFWLWLLTFEFKRSGIRECWRNWMLKNRYTGAMTWNCSRDIQVTANHLLLFM
jgi:hypothetical protein